METTHYSSQARGWQTDVLLLGLLLLGTALFARLAVPFNVHPEEDAAILMRYVQHLAGGHGVVWNIGQAPVDGATDFLLVLLAAGLMRLGMTVEQAVRSLDIAAHGLTVVLVYVALRRLHRAPQWAAFASALYLAVGPGLYYAAAGFGTPLFALAACLTWCFAWLSVQQPTRRGWAWLFAACGLLAGLMRPEGVLLTLLMLASIGLFYGWRTLHRPLLAVLLVFGLLGGAFFVWRWSYFGHPLPTPFIKKGGGALYLNGLLVSLKSTLWLAAPLLPLMALGARARATLRSTLFYLLPVAGFVLLFLFLSDEMNFGGRFQYATLPMLLVSWFSSVAGLDAALRLPAWATLSPRLRLTLGLVALLLLAGLLGYMQMFNGSLALSRSDGRYDAAISLRAYADDGLTLVTSEAGLLPLYSGWRTVDAWGLNDVQIARAGLTWERLDAEQPAVIMFHAFFSPLAEQPGNTPWQRMTRLLRSYAEARGYVLAAAYGINPLDTHYYYVRAGLPQSAEIIARLRGLESSYSYYGRRASVVNYADLRRVP
ncbi:MAG: hypothetical protein ABTQ73_09275 [Caldilineales bacterium]